MHSADEKESDLRALDQILHGAREGISMLLAMRLLVARHDLNYAAFLVLMHFSQARFGLAAEAVLGEEKRILKAPRTKDSLQAALQDDRVRALPDLYGIVQLTLERLLKKK